MGLCGVLASGSYNFANPQTLNRYSYTLNNPMTFTDPSGMDGGSRSGMVCISAVVQGGANPAADIACGVTGLLDWLLFDWLFGGPSFHGSLKPRPEGTGTPDWANADGSLGESLGIPTYPGAPKFNWGGLSGILGLPDAGCEFGTCGAGLGGFQAGVMAAPALGPIAACIAAEPCGTILLGVATVGVLGYDIYQMSKGGKQNVGHDYVRDMARGVPGDYCSALRQIMENARKSGNSKLFNDAKATWKQDCRGY